MDDKPFVHLHVHSQYSLLDGKADIPGLVDKAIADGQPGIALTDHGNMYGIKEFFNYVKKKNSGAEPGKEFKPVLGCEMYVAKGSKLEKKDRTDNGEHLIVLAANLKGYHNLIKLVSRAWSEGYYYHPRTDHEDLERYNEGLIVLSACLGGELPQLIMNGETDKAEERAQWYKGVFGDNYYIELQRHETFKENANRETFIHQQEVNKVLLEIASRNGIKVVATNDVHFVNEDDAEAHDRLICVSMQKKFNEPRMHYTKQEWLKTTEEMTRIFKDIPESLATPSEILDKVEFYSIDHAPIMPTFEIPEDFGTEDEYRKRFTPEELIAEFTNDEHGNVVLSEEEAAKKVKNLGGVDKLYRLKLESDYLSMLTMEGAKERYGDPLSDEVRERLIFELHIMKTMGFPGYFLIVQDFINVARKELGVSVGPGRGSAAGSAAAYCLGITQMDPIKYDLLFERFLNPDRISLPDIDVDFDDDGRAEVLKYVTRKYGEEKVAHIITYQTMATKMAIKDVAKVMDLSVAESNRLAKMVPDRLPEVDGKSPKINFKNCLKYVKEFADEQNNPDPRVRDVMTYAAQLEGNVRTTGIHACGVIIGRDDITDWVPVSMVTDADGSKVISTQYEGSVIEDTGMIKMDFLGLKTLSVIREALDNIKRTRGIDVDIDHIPLDDPKTFALYCAGNTTATFQFESAGMQKSLRELQPSKFEDLIAMNALYRPGPMDYIPSFIARKHGIEEIKYDLPVMEKYLKETYGITVYQEQVMLLSRLLADFTRGESDALRKAMGKKLRDKLDHMKPKFIEGGKRNGHDPKILEKIWADWEKFASYAFNKSHATCYSWVAYQTAYLKANYPAEFMAGVLSRNLTAPDKLRKFMDECKRMGIEVKGPHINESFEKFGVNKNGEIRFGLGAIKGVGQGAVKAIIEERERNGQFADIYDFVERVNLSACNRSAIESLALAGAFDCFGVRREVFVHQILESTFSDMLVKYGQRFQNDKNSLQASLFGDLEPIETNRPPIPQVVPWETFKLLEEEKKLVMIYLSAHPLDPYYMELKYGCTCSCAELNDYAKPGTKALVGGLVTGFSTKISQKGRPYGVLEIEDFTGKTDFRLFGRNYETLSQKVTVGKPVAIEISFKESTYKPGTVDMNIEDIVPLDNYAGKLATKLTIFLSVDHHDEGLAKALAEASDNPARPGDLYIVFVDLKTDNKITLHSRKRYSIDRQFVDMLDDWDVKYVVENQDNS